METAEFRLNNGGHTLRRSNGEGNSAPPRFVSAAGPLAIQGVISYIVNSVNIAYYVFLRISIDREKSIFSELILWALWVHYFFPYVVLREYSLFTKLYLGSLTLKLAQRISLENWHAYPHVWKNLGKMVQPFFQSLCKNSRCRNARVSRLSHTGERYWETSTWLKGVLCLWAAVIPS